MRIWSPGHVRHMRLSLGTLTISLASMAAQGQSVAVAGWVENDPATHAPPTAAFRLLRAGQTVAYPESGLLACDMLALVDDKATVRVVLVSNLRMQLDAHTPGRQIEVPCNERGVAADLAAALRALIGGVEQRKARVAALTRNLPPLTVPALMVPAAIIVAGKRSIYLAWTGGEGPFSVQVIRASDGREVVSQSNIAGHSSTLPLAEFAPGIYTLWVRNRTGSHAEGFRQDALVAVGETSLPAVPEILMSPSLTTESRTLFYADYLASLDDGRWTFEALQLVGSLSIDSPAVRQWLLRYGVATN